MPSGSSSAEVSEGVTPTLGLPTTHIVLGQIMVSIYSIQASGAHKISSVPKYEIYVFYIIKNEHEESHAYKMDSDAFLD